jgi:hypothetical protein
MEMPLPLLPPPEHIKRYEDEYIELKGKGNE